MNSLSVFIIILNFNGYQDTIKCVESLSNILYKNFRIIIVDNNSTDNSVLILKQTFPKIDIIQTEANLGYAAGNNFGIKYAVECGAQYLCILNNDTIAHEDFLSPLVRRLNSNSQKTIIGPMILEKDNHTIQSTGARIDMLRGRVPVINSGKIKKEISNKLIECDYIGGACLLFRCDSINELGLFPENYFLFYEETEWCLRAKKNGFQIVCDPSTSIVHEGSSSIKRVSGLIEYLLSRNRVVFMRRNSNVYTFSVFMIYLNFETIFKVMMGKKSIKTFCYFWDGILNKVRSEYDFIYINK
jgi:GT2 family glycosyltransferase